MGTPVVWGGLAERGVASSRLPRRSWQFLLPKICGSKTPIVNHPHFTRIVGGRNCINCTDHPKYSKIAGSLGAIHTLEESVQLPAATHGDPDVISIVPGIPEHWTSRCWWWHRTWRFQLLGTLREGNMPYDNWDVEILSQRLVKEDYPLIIINIVPYVDNIWILSNSNFMCPAFFVHPPSGRSAPAAWSTIRDFLEQNQVFNSSKMWFYESFLWSFIPSSGKFTNPWNKLETMPDRMVVEPFKQCHSECTASVTGNLMNCCVSQSRWFSGI